MNITAIITAISPVVVAIAAAATAIFAWKALSTWKDQFKTKNNHELAQKLLMSIYKYRDAIANIRTPTLYMVDIHANEQEKYSATCDHFQKKYDMVSECLAEIDSARVEAEAIWDSNILSHIGAIYSFAGNLKRLIYHHLEAQNPNYSTDQQSDHRKIVMDDKYGLFDRPDKDDPFKKDLEEAITNIEKYLKEKMLKM